MPGVHETPDKFRDEDKWFKFFTKRQLLILGPTFLAVIGFNSLIFSSPLKGLFPITLLIGELFFIAAVVIAFFEVPDHMYMFGSGLKIEILIFRLIKKKLSKSHRIYTKFLDNDIERWK
ncbi:MAG: hypothetical protein K6F84_05255 [Lachnospiraceae bacterium]|nr:hypothetical protein [Lachnospiraceae bacterium]